MLSDLSIRQAKPRERDYKLSDANHLYLLVRPTGSKLWRFAYRFAGKQKLLALGAYPTVTLAEARERRDAARKLLANGKTPASSAGWRRSRQRPAATPSRRSPRSSWTSSPAKVGRNDPDQEEPMAP